jgi:transcriptional regulator with PAS, ATPase and Fis domain
LAGAILQQLSTRRRRSPAALAANVWDAFARYSWPGNVRELENTLERMIVAAGGDMLLTPAHMPDDFRASTEETRAPLPEADAIRARTVMPSPVEARAALQRHGFKYGKTATELGISRHQLYRLLKRRAVAGSPADRAPA